MGKLARETGAGNAHTDDGRRGPDHAAEAEFGIADAEDDASGDAGKGTFTAGAIAYL